MQRGSGKVQSKLITGTPSMESCSYQFALMYSGSAVERGSEYISGTKSVLPLSWTFTHHRAFLPAQDGVEMTLLEKKVKASDLFVQALENEGIEYVFALPGKSLKIHDYIEPQKSSSCMPHCNIHGSTICPCCPASPLGFSMRA